jgi:uncharacterized protein (TIGR03437 family)
MLLLRTLLLIAPLLLVAQDIAIPFLGRPITFLPPGIGAAGKTVVFGSSITPAGATANTTDIYVAGADGAGLRRLTQLPASPTAPAGATAVSLSADGNKAAYTLLRSPAGGSAEEIHTVDVATGKDVTAAVYTEGCIQPLCVNCFATCVHTPHLTSDGSKVLYQVARSPSFFVANSDGTGLTRLPVYTGSLAPAPMRVISNGGLVVLTSNAPFGPTFAASATDVYLMNLDGANIRAITRFGNDSSIFSRNATISADGSTIAFETNYAGSTFQVWAVASDGSNLRQLTFGSDAATNPSLSADGSLLTVLQDGQVVSMRTFGKGPVRLLASFRMSSAQDPVMSDDGSRVAFDIGPKSGGIGAVYSVGADGANLTAVYAPRSLNPLGVGSPSPGGLISAYGTNLTGDSLVVAASWPLPQSLAGVSLLVNGIPAPLLAVTPWQLNVQIPSNTPSATVPFQLQFADGKKADSVDAEVRSIAPAIFYYPVTSGGAASYWQAAALHAGTGVPADAAHPAVAGETLEIYGTGLGATNPAVPAGTPAPLPPARTITTPQVRIGSRPATVVFSGLTPGMAGVYQVNAIVPSGLPAGRFLVTWQAASTTSSDSIGTISLR